MRRKPLRSFDNASYKRLQRHHSPNKDPGLELGYGVIAVFTCSGLMPMDDECHLDGWYYGEYGKALALGMFKYFQKRYPTADIHLVTRTRSKWRTGSP